MQLLAFAFAFAHISNIYGNQNVVANWPKELQLYSYFKQAIKAP